MKNRKYNNQNGGCSIYLGGGLWTLLFIIMFILKVLGVGAVANWSWWIVTAPLWIPLALTFLIIILLGIIWFIIIFFF